MPASAIAAETVVQRSRTISRGTRAPVMKSWPMRLAAARAHCGAP